MIRTNFNLKQTFVAVAAGAFFLAGSFLLAPSTAEAAKAKKKAAVAVAPPKAPGSAVEKKDTGATIPGGVVEKQVEKLTDKIDWLSSLEVAKDQARKRHKLVFWLHALGDLDGEC